MYNLKCVALSVALVALVAPLCIEWTANAQKTIKGNQFQQSWQSSGSNPQSVYGGYQQSSASSSRRQSSTALAAPVQQQRSQQTYSSRRTETRQQQQPVYQQEEDQPQPQQIASSSSSSSSSSYEQAESDAEPASYGAVQGQPGKDFPAYTRVPKTSFSCDGLPYDYGMYADEETGCQAYHVCYNGRKESFLCGVGTVFNQRILHCDYWYSVECNKSSQYYSSNAYMGSSQPEPGPAQASGSSYQRTEQASQSSASYNRPAKTNNLSPARQQQQQQASSSYNKITSGAQQQPIQQEQY